MNTSGPLHLTVPRFPDNLQLLCEEMNDRNQNMVIVFEDLDAFNMSHLSGFIDKIR